MRPANTTTTASTAGFRHWKSPLPYLFGGLALMLGLIAIALIILACSFRRAAAANSSSQADEKPAKRPDTELRFVVIMPGDNNPKYLAKPAAPDHHGEQV